MKTTVAPAPHLRRVGWIITIASLVAIAFATLAPEPPGPVVSHFCLACGSFGTVDAMLNIVLFVPLGIGLALSAVPGKRALLAVIPGRDSTLGDVLTNTVGGALGFAIAAHARLLLQPPPRIATNLVAGWAVVWLTIQAISSYGFAVTLPHTQYFGQIARTLGNFGVFPGHVLSAGVDGVHLPDTAIGDSRAVEQLLRDGATVTAQVISAEPPREIAPIVRLADSRKREIVLLAQERDGLVFGVRTGAAALRVRPPLFSLRGAFPSHESSGSLLMDTVTVSGQYAGNAVTLQADRRLQSREHRIQLSSSLGWTLWLPFRWFIEGTRTEQAVGWLWLGFLTIPLGYWSIRGRDWSAPQRVGWREATFLVSLITFMGGGLTLFPHLFGLPGGPSGDWAATFVGFFAGYALGAQNTQVSMSA